MGTVKNVEMNYFNGADYDVIYPQSLLENITDWENDIYDKTQIDDIKSELQNNITTVSQTPSGWEDIGNFQGSKTVTKVGYDWSNNFSLSIPSLERNYLYFIDMKYLITVYATTSDYVDIYYNVRINNDDFARYNNSIPGQATMQFGYTAFLTYLSVDGSTALPIVGNNIPSISVGRNLEWICSFSSDTIQRQKPVVNNAYIHICRTKISDF